MAEINNLVVAEKSDLVAIANAIRAKSGNTNSFSFPHDFISSIEGIVSGGGSGSGSGDGDFVTVTFYDTNGDVLKKEMVNRNAKVYAPINANGTSLKFGETAGTINYVSFPIIANSDKSYYQCGKGVTLPDGYCKYTVATGNKNNTSSFSLIILPDSFEDIKIWNNNYTGSWYCLCKEGVKETGTTGMYGAKMKSFSSIELALEALKNISEGSVDISTLNTSGNLTFYYGYTYYSNFDIYQEQACENVIAPRNDYMYE